MLLPARAAEERDIEGGETFAARAGSNIGKSFGVAAEGHGDLVGEIRAIGDARFEESANVAADLFGLDGANGAGNAGRGHETNGADGKLGALENCVVAKDGDFETAAAEIDDTVGLRFRAESGDGGFPAEAGFFFCGDDFDAKAGGLLDAVDKGATVASFAGGAGGDSAIFGDAVLFHNFVKVAEGFDAF